MKNTIKFILSIVLIIFVYLAYRGYVTYFLITESAKLSNDQISDIFEKEKSIWSIKPDNNNFPEYAQNFVPEEKYKEVITDISNLIYKEDFIYSTYFQNQILEKTNKIIPSNLLDYKNTLIPVIKRKMETSKRREPPSYKDCFELPGPPKTSFFRATCRYWYALSRYFDNNQDYETSLLLSLGILYLSKDFNSNYSQSFCALNKAVCISLNNIACDSILIWASKPKNQYGTLSKKVAKDILDYVKSEYPISCLFKNTKEAMDNDLKVLFKHFAKGWLKNYPQTNNYKNYMYLLFDKPQKFFDKPSYEIEKELSELEKDKDKVFCYFDMMNSLSVKSIFNIFFYTEDVIVAKFFVLYFPNLKKLKYDFDKALAKMEFTAIALIINAFYAENNRIPASIEELSSWFGEDLPKNRLTGKPYELDLSGKHLLTNREIEIGMSNLVFDFIR